MMSEEKIQKLEAVWQRLFPTLELPHHMQFQFWWRFSGCRPVVVLHAFLKLAGRLERGKDPVLEPGAWVTAVIRRTTLADVSVPSELLEPFIERKAAA
jgi:hypothetical protein